MTAAERRQPVAEAGAGYTERGWPWLPLPYARKKSPPDGTTGYRGRFPTDTDRAAWLASRPGDNIALRMPPDVVGIDVDAYNGGDATLAALEAEHGPLPPTVASTSRTDGSGIRLFRVPAGTVLVGKIEPGIEVCQFHHRYVIAAPSLHPEGRTYRWLDELSGEVLEYPPAPWELPELPWRWIEALAVTGKGKHAERAATAAEVLEFIDAHTEANRPAALKGIRTKLAGRNQRGGKGGRHDTLVEIACWAMREAAAGYYPADDALDTLEDWWHEKAVADPTRDTDSDPGEFASAVAWAVAEAIADPDRVAAIRERPEPWQSDDLEWKDADRLAGEQNCSPDPAPVVNADARLELPEGYVLWTGADRPGRPEASPGMFYGPLGEFAEAAGEHTEADPVAVLAQALAAFGTAAHRGPHLLAGNDRHAAALFVLVIGRSAKARKGTSWAAVRDLIRRADAGLLERVLSGFGSGEALIAELAPPTGAEATVSALRDTRALVVESEFGEVLARARREGSTTSAILRNAWDGRPLQNRTRGTGKLVATDYHLGAVGHITAPELRAKLTDTDVYGGFLNRWLPFYVERSRLLPDGGNVPAELLDRYGRRLRDALTSVRGATVIERDAEAGELWRELYAALEDDDPPGILGHVVARGAAQTLRLSLVFALADGSRVITADHVGAAYLVWTYSRASAAALFGETTGDRDADRLLDALREAGPGGMDGTTVRDLFARKPGKADAARHVLEAHGMATAITDKGTGGRPRVTLYAIRRAA